MKDFKLTVDRAARVLGFSSSWTILISHSRPGRWRIFDGNVILSDFTAEEGVTDIMGGLCESMKEKGQTTIQERKWVSQTSQDYLTFYSVQTPKFLHPWGIDHGALRNVRMISSSQNPFANALIILCHLLPRAEKLCTKCQGSKYFKQRFISLDGTLIEEGVLDCPECGARGTLSHSWGSLLRNVVAFPFSYQSEREELLILSDELQKDDPLGLWISLFLSGSERDLHPLEAEIKAALVEKIEEKSAALRSQK